MEDILLPEVGENITSGTVIGISVNVGDTITKDQDLLEFETDKASLPVPSPVEGVVKEILINEGDEIEIGSVIMKVDVATTVAPQAQATPATPKEKPTQKTIQTPKAQPSIPKPQPVAQPINRSLANENIPAQIDVSASPSVRRLAREIGIIVSQVPGSGPGGRVSKDDVKLFAKSIILGGGTQAKPTVAMEPRPLPTFEKFGDVKREKMNNIRKKTAEHLTFCWQTIPHVTQFDKADITDIEKLRKKNSTETRKLTVTSFLLKIMAQALKEFPQFNASIDMESKEIILKSYINLGVAVDTERGLMVPVLKDADKQNVFEITDNLNVLAEKARTKKIALDDIQGGGMTLTNLGGIGGTSFTPIVNWPEVAILGVSRARFEPVFNKESKEFAPRFMMPLSLSYDHRIIDGADGARFLKYVVEAIENPANLLDK
jgi:pyruvate dehydrogenase E2 component (dihydrolipoamide acetyltransferase)